MTNEIAPEDDEFDFWTDRLGIKYGSYNSAIDRQIYDVATIIVNARKTGNHKNAFCTGIADQLGLSPEHVELIQYILAGVTYPDRPHLKNMPFTYGASPRGLFVDDEECADRFLAELRKEIDDWEKTE